MTKYFNRFDGARTAASLGERCTGFRKGIDGARRFPFTGNQPEKILAFTD
ncbi:hypothetical protein NDI47_06190 [Microcoleus vaginatus GB1-A2]